MTPTEVVTYDEALHFIERHQLMGRGIDYVDVHLLASVAMTPPNYGRMTGGSGRRRLNSASPIHPERERSETK